MKLSVAATLLAQCVPALPQALPVQDLGNTADHVVQSLNHVQEATRSTHPIHKLKRITRHARQRALSKVQGILKNVSPQLLKGRLQCDPLSTDPDTGILSCGDGLVCKESLASDLGGFCLTLSATQGTADRRMQARAIMREIVTASYPSVSVDKDSRLPCDPNAPDLGILSCGLGEFCRHDSDMGGICVPSVAVSRKLYTVDDVLPLCDPASNDYIPYCDCTGVDTTTGSGTITCLSADNAVCEGVVADISAIYSFASRNLTSLAICYEVTTPSYQKACVASNYPNGANVSDSCSIEFNGQACSSCVATDSFYDFDCSAIDPNLVGSSLPELLPAIATCYGSSGGGGNYSVCPPCTEGTTIPSANYGVNVTIAGVGYLSCGELAYGAANGFVPDAYCSIFAGIAQTSCCAPESTEPASTPAPSSAAGGEPAPAPEGGEPAPAPEGGEPAPAPEGGEPAPAPEGGSSAARVLVHGVVWSVIVSTLAQIFVP